MARLPILLLALPTLLLTACDPGGGADDDDPDGGDDAPETTLTATPDALTNQVPARFEFTADRDATFRCAIDDAPESDCSSPLTARVDDGAHTFLVRAVGRDGIADPSPARHAWTTDTVAPETTLTVVPAALDNSTTVSFEFTASEGATYGCAIDGAAALPCVSPHVVADLLDGPHRFTVAAGDAAGNVDASPAAHAWTIDSSTPDTVIDRGPSGDVATSDATFEFSSPDAGAGATFECSLDSAAWASCSSPRDLASLAQGAHTFEVRVREASGNVDPTPARRQWTVDLIGPTATIMELPSPMNDRTPAFTFTVADAPTVIECRFDEAAFAACTSPHEPAAPLADGAHVFEVRVADAAGNRNTAAHSFAVDTVAPVVTLAAVPSPTSDRSPTFTFTVSGDATAVECRYGTQAFAACASPYTNAGLLHPGSHLFEVRATDAAGNSGSATREVVIDFMRPTATIVDGPAAGSLTNDRTPTFTFDLTDAPTVVECRFDADAFAPCTSPHEPAAPLADGDHTFEIHVADDAGNASTTARSFAVDTVEPVITIAASPAATRDRTPTFTFTVSGAAATVQCRFDAQAFAACTSPYTPGSLLDGDHVFEVRATDAAGNLGSATRAITIDTIRPTATILSGPAEGSVISSRTPTFTFSVGGNPTTILCRTSSMSMRPCDPAVPFVTTTPMGDGDAQFDVFVADDAGNQFFTIRAFRVDATPPTVHLIGPADGVVVHTRTPAWNLLLENGAAEVACRIDNEPFGPCTSPTSYVAPTLADGPHTAQARARDEVGNEAISTREFVVAGPPE